MPPDLEIEHVKGGQQNKRRLCLQLLLILSVHPFSPIYLLVLGVVLIGSKYRNYRQVETSLTD